MKRCPECEREYYDETLNYCLEDGASLVDTDEPLTAILSTDVPGSETATRQKHDQTAREGLALTTSPYRARPWLLPVLAVLVFGILGYAAYLYFPSGASSKPIDSIAVLPFQSRGVDADTQYLSEGLAESLIYRLSQLESLKVSPTSSVFYYENKDIDPVAVGKELGVNAVLSGRIVQHGDDLTISANLVDVRDNRLIWGEQYERKMSQLLETQREIAREIVENLRLKVAPNEKGLTKHYTESNEAYQLYLKGRFYWSKRTNESMHRSIDLYQQAIEIDPTFALAYSGLADTYNLICAPEAGGGDESPNEVLPKARTAALKAISLDPTLAEPHGSDRDR